jgi:hypothetical protein
MNEVRTTTDAGTPIRRQVARLVGLSALAGTIVPAALFMAGWLDHGSMQRVMLVAAVAWFAAAPWWMHVE